MLLSGAIHPCASSELGALVCESTQRKFDDLESELAVCPKVGG
jgi:hypothetical protein